MAVIFHLLNSVDHSSVLLLVSCLLLAGIQLLQRYSFSSWKQFFFTRRKNQLPPFISASLPFFGHAFAYGKNPKEFLLNAYRKYGPAFRFTMMGKTFTFLVGPEASREFYYSPNDQLNGEEMNSKITTPILGKDTAYDVPHSVMLEQFRLIRKSGLTRNRMEEYASVIEDEVTQYLEEKWGETGSIDILHTFRELCVRCGPKCLLGTDVTKAVNLDLYHDLISGFHPLVMTIPSFMQSAVFYKRDRANAKIRKIFQEIINKRREEPTREDDTLQRLMESKNKHGQPLTDTELIGIMTALMTLGTEEPSITSTWFGLFLAKHQDVQEQIYQEQMEDASGLDYKVLEKYPALERGLKETLRLRPPAFTFIRKCRKDKDVLDYTLTPGTMTCISIIVNQTLPEIWGEDAEDFKPDRFIDFGNNPRQQASYTPFGAGTHKCLGPNFAMLEMKTIWATILRKYKLELPSERFPVEDRTTLFLIPDDKKVIYKKR
ncbi:lanosterol 14-alpha demethylase [Lingula anatina]|uniref:Lanosterol 14-alpha demethylase n=1 Tax=Lingula anatina TaxID=7574 RepID=A0A1S3JMD6_LINAN|nr:lanosterol 14-alpha demethylase [Lingula anatina]XP_013411070.1 lanosterol 14-alpha demethylase [Lingula anatina]XP_013411071.1 lanosterol 14-alpha demethylase [Lingula anatina]XP_023932758.1 lanosterol 14-alpha demethylase [Lingula anatina]|eukprot:XP_013411069.1 lanosterol 14-alpha demethylase [Lingula anatina]